MDAVRCELGDASVELRMAARWKLGRALAKVERKPGARTDISTSSGSQIKLYVGLFKDLKLDKMAAQEAQGIGCMPDEEMAHRLRSST
jgi:hypothetical protein